MPCYHPLHAFDVGQFWPETGSVKLKIVSGDVTELWHNGVLYTDYIEVPCHKCIGCRLEYARQWSMRCMLEASYHDHNCFITLTYDDEHLPPRNKIKDANGNEFLSPLHPLVKKHFQDFMKRFRQRLKDNFVRDYPDEDPSNAPRIRFFACGEYGSQSGRPHYHAIIFGYDFHEDRIPYKQNFRKDMYYTSPLLNSLWPFGYAVIGDCTFESCSYTARYVLKKKYGVESDLYDDLGYPKEFVLMSRRPGIGRLYYDDHSFEIYKNEEVFLSDVRTGFKLKPPKYFDKIQSVERPLYMRFLKDRRLKNAITSTQLADAQSDLSHMDRLADDERRFKDATKLIGERSKV